MLNTGSTVQILETTTDTATQVQGHTTDWTVTITLPSNTPLGNYLLDIAYSEDPKISLQDGMNMQDATAELCANTSMGTTVNLKDTRDNKYYRVRKMADNRCWMIDNLAYDINTAPTQGKPAYNPTAQLVSGTTASVSNRAQYVENNNIAGQGQIPNNGNPTPSYLYNWCAALGDTSTNCSASVAATANQTVINGTTNTTGTTTSQPEVTGICPAPFRLPKGGPAATSSNLSTTANEFSKLDIAMGGTGANRTGANTYPNFTSDNTTDPSFFWSGVFSGNYFSGLHELGSSGAWRSSTASSGTYDYSIGLGSSTSAVNPANSNNRVTGVSVRCIL